MTSRSLLLALLALSALGACKKKSSEPPPQSEEDRKRDAFLAKAEADLVAKLEAKLKVLEGVTLPPPAAHDGVELDANGLYAWWVNTESLGAIANDPKGVITDVVKESHVCFEQIRHPPFGKREYSKIERCDRAHHALVIRTLERRDPVITDYGKPGQMGEFKPGAAHGDVVAFDLATGKPVGSFRWSAKSGDTSDKLSLQRDFERALSEAVQRAAQQFVKRP